MRRGQAATEYLSTYIWTAVGLLIVFGTLNYFGAFETTNYLTESCETGVQIVCKEVTLNSYGTFQIAVSNQLTRDIMINEFVVTDYGAYKPNISIGAGHTEVLTIIGQKKYDEGTKEEFSFEIIYQRNESGARNHTISGTAVAEVQKSTITCDDGTHDRTCSLEQPLFCNGGEFEVRCDLCGCPTNAICQEDLTCKADIVIDEGSDDDILSG